MRLIPWVDVIERDPTTDDGHIITNSYPFPDVDMKYYHKLIGSDYTRLKGSIPLETLRHLIDAMDDNITKDCYHTRLHFIMNRWHPRNFVEVNFRNWRYKT